MLFTSSVLLVCCLAIAVVTHLGIRARRRALPEPRVPLLPELPAADQDAKSTREQLLESLPPLPHKLDGIWEIADGTLSQRKRKQALSKLGRATEDEDTLVALLVRVTVEGELLTEGKGDPLAEACLSALYQHYQAHPTTQRLLAFLAVRHPKAVWRVKCLQALRDHSDAALLELGAQRDAPLSYRKKLLRETIPRASGAALAPLLDEILRSAPQALAQQALVRVTDVPEQHPGAEQALLRLVRAPTPQEHWAITSALNYLARRHVADALPIARAYMARREHLLGALEVIARLGDPSDLPELDVLARRQLFGSTISPQLRDAAGRAAAAIRARINTQAIGGLMLAEDDAQGRLSFAEASQGELMLHEDKK
jgi:hypothetical protein